MASPGRLPVHAACAGEDHRGHMGAAIRARVSIQPSGRLQCAAQSKSYRERRVQQGRARQPAGDRQGGCPPYRGDRPGSGNQGSRTPTLRARGFSLAALRSVAPKGALQCHSAPSSMPPPARRSQSSSAVRLASVSPPPSAPALLDCDRQPARAGRLRRATHRRGRAVARDVRGGRAHRDVRAAPIRGRGRPARRGDGLFSMQQRGFSPGQPDRQRCRSKLLLTFTGLHRRDGQPAMK